MKYTNTRTAHTISRHHHHRQHQHSCCIRTTDFFVVAIQHYCRWLQCVCVYVWYSWTVRSIQFIQLNYYTIYARTTGAYLWLQWNNWNEWDNSKERCGQQSTVPIISSFPNILHRHFSCFNFSPFLLAECTVWLCRPSYISDVCWGKQIDSHSADACIRKYC